MCFAIVMAIGVVILTMPRVCLVRFLIFLLSFMSPTW